MVQELIKLTTSLACLQWKKKKTWKRFRVQRYLHVINWLNNFFKETVILCPEKAPVSINTTACVRKATGQEGLHLVETHFTLFAWKIVHALRKQIDSIGRLAHFVKRELVADHLLLHWYYQMPIPIHVKRCVAHRCLPAWAGNHVHRWVCMCGMNPEEGEEDRRQKIRSRHWN